MIFYANSVKYIIYLVIGLSFHRFLSNESNLALCVYASPYLHSNANSIRFANIPSKYTKTTHHFSLIASNDITDDEIDNESIEEDEEDLDDKSSAVYTSTSNNSIQYMITNKMKKILQNDLGYTNDEINQMEPQIASVVIDRKLHRPLKGMPPTWKKQISTMNNDNDGNNNNTNDNPLIKNISKMLRKSIKIILNNRIIHILSGVTIIWYNQASITNLIYCLKNILSKPFNHKKNVINQQQYPFTSRKLSDVLPKQIVTKPKDNKSLKSIFNNIFMKKQSQSKTLFINNDKKILKTVNLKTLSSIEAVSLWDRIQLLRMKIFNI